MLLRHPPAQSGSRAAEPSDLFPSSALPARWPPRFPSAQRPSDLKGQTPRNPNRTDENESLSERPTLSTRRHRAQVCARWWCAHPRSRPRFFGFAAQVGSEILECSTPPTPAMIYIKEARRPKPTGVMAPTLETEVQYLKGVGPQRAALLAERGIYTVEDLLGHLPFRYE